MAHNDFIPAKPSPLLRKTLYHSRGVLLPVLTGVSRIEYEPEGLERLRQLEPHTVVLTPNHPTLTEPMLMFLLSCEVDQFFYYMTAREVFDYYWGFQGKVVQRIGSYSVVRGAIDRTSFRVTREKLARRGTKLVVFPEGEVYLQSQTVLPFQNGVFQMAFKGLEDIQKEGRTGEPLYIVPVGFSYRFASEPKAEIEASLTRLENAVGIAPQPGRDGYERVRAVSEAVLCHLEKEYEVRRKPAAKAAEAENPTENTRENPDLTGRLQAVKEAILRRVSAAAEVPAPRGENIIERMRNLHTQVKGMIQQGNEEEVPPYNKTLIEQRRQRLEPLIQDLNRLSNWIASYDGYIRERPTPERMVDVLIRLEKECLGKQIIRVSRQCTVRVGEPINLNDRWEAYQGDRKGEVERVTREAERQILTLTGATPLPREVL
ncbi:MAG: glycerol acyltransferase [Armatimonadaceae bacterium]